MPKRSKIQMPPQQSLDSAVGDAVTTVSQEDVDDPLGLGLLGDSDASLDSPAGGVEPEGPATEANPFAPFRSGDRTGASGQDPWSSLASRIISGGKKEEEPEAVPPGTTRPLTDEDMARKGTIDFPDDQLVTVKLWEWIKGKAEPVSTMHDVLFSVARDPFQWIPYGGSWYFEIIQPETRKKLVKKTFTTRGEAAPRTWRPEIGGTDMDSKQMAEAFAYFQRMQGAGFSGSSGMVPGMPAGAIPQGVYTDVSANLRTEISDLKSKIAGLETKLENTTRDLNRSERERDNALGEIRHLSEKNTELREEMRNLKSDGIGGGKPPWVYALEAIGKKDDGSIKPADLMAMQRDMMMALQSMKQSGGPAEAIAYMNSVVDAISKMQVASGIRPGGDTTDKVIGAIGKGLEIVQKRQEMASMERRVGSTQAHQGPKQPSAQAEKPNAKQAAKIALDETMRRLFDAVKAQEDPEIVGEALAASIMWAGKTGIAEEDDAIYQFLKSIVDDPHKAISFYCSSNKISDDYAKKIADAYVRAMGLTPKSISKEEKTDSGNGEKKQQAEPAVPAKDSTPSDGKGQDAAVAVPAKGNGGGHAGSVDLPPTAAQSVDGSDNLNVPPQTTQNEAQSTGQPS